MSREFLTNWTVANAEASVDRWWHFSDRLIARYANGMVNDFVNGTTANPGYPVTWYDSNGYQYGPRVYDMEGLGAISGLAYVNNTVLVSPGDELRLIRETQRRAGNGTASPSPSP